LQSGYQEEVINEEAPKEAEEAELGLINMWLEWLLTKLIGSEGRQSL